MYKMPTSLCKMALEFIWLPSTQLVSRRQSGCYRVIESLA
jgi:hypothetical protein